MTPDRYQPNDRLVDDEDRLRTLYCDEDLTIREIADEHADVGRTKVSEALDEYGISESCPSTPQSPSHGERGIDPPSDIDWGILT